MQKQEQNKPVHRHPASAPRRRSAAHGRDELRRELATVEEQFQREIRNRIELERKLAARGAPDLDTMRQRLHDGLGQLLTSITFLASSLSTKLAAQGLKDAAELDQILDLLHRAINESRALVAQCDRARRAFGERIGPA